MITAPPKDFDHPASNYIPPDNPYGGPARVRQVNVPEVSKGKILLDSGATTHGHLEDPNEEGDDLDQ